MIINNPSTTDHRVLGGVGWQLTFSAPPLRGGFQRHPQRARICGGGGGPETRYKVEGH